MESTVQVIPLQQQTLHPLWDILAFQLQCYDLPLIALSWTGIRKIYSRYPGRKRILERSCLKSYLTPEIKLLFESEFLVLYVTNLPPL